MAIEKTTEYIAYCNDLWQKNSIFPNTSILKIKDTQGTECLIKSSERIQSTIIPSL